MLSTAKKKDKAVFLFVPLLIAVLCFFVVYASGIGSYYESYENIISSTYPDYMILNENSSVFQNPNFSKTSINNLFSLEDYEYMGYLESEIIIGEFSKTDFAIVWAPSSYYYKYANLTLNTGEFLIESSLQNEYFNDSNQIFTSFRLNNGFEINETLLLVNFVQRGEIFVSNSLSDILKKEFEPDLYYIFMNDETFENLFVEQLGEVNSYNVYFFQFKRNEIYSKAISKITDFLKTKESKLNSHFGYQYIGKEYRFQQELLREKLVYFENNIKAVRNIQMIPLLLIIGVFTTSLVYITSRTYISNQSDSINLFRIRGGRKSEIYKLFLGSEMKIIFFTYLSSLFISIIILFSIIPSFLKFSVNYLILAGTLLLIVIACGAFQIIMLLRSLQKRDSYQSTEKNIIEGLKAFIKDVGILTIPSAMCFFIFFLLSNILWEFVTTFEIWELILYLLTILLVIYLSTRKTLLKIGVSMIFAFTKRVKIFRYTKQKSKKILLKRNLLSKLIIVFILLMSISFSVLDSYNHYLIENEQYNQICDITINYPISSRYNVENELQEYVNRSIELIHFRFIKEIVTIQGGIVSVDGYCINSTKIDELFENEIFQDSYTGLKTPHEVSEKLSESNRSMIVSKGVSIKTDKGIGENLSFFWRDTDKYYTGQINDYVETIPIFSWLTKNYYSGNTVSSSVNFIVLNSDFEENLLEIENLDIISILSLKKTITREEVRSQIEKLNSMKHLGIKIIDFTNIRFFDKYYQSVIIQPEFLLILIILIGIALFIFLLENSNQLFNRQIKSFSVFF